MVHLLKNYFIFALVVFLFPSSTLATNLSDAYLYDYQANGISSQASGGKRALDVGIDVGGTQIDPRTRSWSLLNTTDSVNAVQSGAWTITVGNFPSVFGVTQSGTWSVGINNFPTTQAISASALPLPSGASTSSLQNDEITGLTNITTATNTNTSYLSFYLPTLATSANQTTELADLSSIVTNTTGNATSANQTTGNTSLASIVTNQNAVAGSVGGGTAATKSLNVGGVYHATVPTLTDGQQAGFTLESDGSLNTYSANENILLNDVNGYLFDIYSRQPPLGANTKSNSTPVTIASDQGALAVSQSGTFTTGRTWSLSSGSDSVAVTGTVTASNASIGTNGSAIPSSSTLVGGSDGTNLRSFKTSTTGVLSVDGSAVTQPISGSISVSNFPSSQAVTGAFYQATQPVSAASLPLPSRAATSAKQPALGTAGSASSDVLSVQGIASMTPLLVNGSGVTQPISGSVSVSNFPATQPVSIATMPTTPVTGTFYQTTQPVSAASLPLPSGAATSALQTTGNTSLSTIATNIPAQGQALSAASMPVVLPAAQIITLTPPTSVTVTQATGTNLHAVLDSGTVTTITNAVPTKAPVNANASLLATSSVTTTETSYAAPSNAVGIILECESGNAGNIRWGFSNSSTAILSTTKGMLCEPGRDSGFLPIGLGNYVHFISVAAGTNNADVQWVLSQ